MAELKALCRVASPFVIAGALDSDVGSGKLGPKIGHGGLFAETTPRRNEQIRVSGSIVRDIM